MSCLLTCTNLGSATEMCGRLMSYTARRAVFGLLIFLKRTFMNALTQEFSDGYVCFILSLQALVYSVAGGHSQSAEDALPMP